MRLKSFRSFSDDRSRILILGSMPGPEALRRREYYGFPGNHFWRIIHDLLQGGECGRRAVPYKERLALLREHRIALWDVIRSCDRKGAGDGSIRNARPNDISALLRRRPGIQAVFLNGRTAERYYRRHFGDTIKIPTYYLPSTSPAHASMIYAKKLKAWGMIMKYLGNRNPWC